jgi:glycosyltransferase involved in cell wall biosynthesis
MSTLSKKLHVLMVTARYFPMMGGIETHVYEVGRRLAASNTVDITLLTTIPHSLAMQAPEEEYRDGMRILRVQAWPRERDYYISPAIYSIIRDRQWDLIHCQGCHTFVPPLAMLAARRARIPYVVTFHSGGHSSRWRTSIRASQWNVLRPLFVDAQKLIGVSRFEADYFRELLRLPSQQFTVIPNGGNWSAVSSSPVEMEHPCLILSVGRLERYKGHQHLITALPHIKRSRPDARLLILGAGPYEANLRQLAQNIGVADAVEIRAIPPNERQVMQDLLRQAKLVVLLSEYEAHPVAIMEALALQRPTLVTHTSGLAELAEKKLVRSVPLNSTPETIAAAVVQQIEQPLIPAHVALPTWDECAQQLLDIYTLALKRETCVS